jgi:1-deoxy-D-xylulose-5-phosphate reductoisomerase
LTPWQKEGNAPAVLNAANEVAVARFLNDEIAFVQLPDVVEYALSRVSYQSKPDLEVHLASDTEARAFALEF